jgi:CubicO group peptidase (beta-lactamase class C family)
VASALSSRPERSSDASFPRRDFLSLPLWLLAGCARLGERPVPPWQTLVEYLERELPALLDRAVTTPGIAMALVADAKPVWARGFGVTDRTTNAPVDTDTVFEFASVSKTVFAYAILKACENGVLDLDTPLTKYTSERFIPDDPRLDLMTARHVLSHTGGFQNWRSKENPLRIHFTPGERWEYSGEGYSYLQAVLTHLTGRVDPSECKTFEDGVRMCATDFDAYMRANLLEPFGMRSSGYVYRDGMARPHDHAGVLVPGRIGSRADAARYGSAGQLHSSVADYARFLTEIIEPSDADRFHVAPESHKEMLRPQVRITDTLSWALGWAVEQHPGMGDIVSHSGDNPGFKAMTAASRRRRSAFVIVTNGDRGFEDVIRPLLRSGPMREFLPVAV